MTVCEECGEPFLDCCEDRTLCAKCIKKKVRGKLEAHLGKRSKGN